MRNYRVRVKLVDGRVLMGGYKSSSIKELRRELELDTRIKIVLSITPERAWLKTSTVETPCT